MHTSASLSQTSWSLQVRHFPFHCHCFSVSKMMKQLHQWWSLQCLPWTYSFLLESIRKQGFCCWDYRQLYKFWPRWVVLAPHFFGDSQHRISKSYNWIPFSYTALYLRFSSYILYSGICNVAWGTASEITFSGLHEVNLPEGKSYVLDTIKWMDCEDVVPWIFMWELGKKKG